MIRRRFNVGVLEAIPERNAWHALSSSREMVARPKMSRNEWKTTELRGFKKLANVSPFSIIPGQLVSQLGQSSDEFFVALSNFRSLWEEVRATCGRVKALRGKVRDMQCETVQGTMRVPRLACKQ